ncbi:hypothetical protein, partial [uncultured Acetobacterium sp.]|uniref:hypothetical protein n=1 Tax=uncultured Acetobacterium sp. TaxID=217139 RepID=UPI0025F3DD83
LFYITNVIDITQRKLAEESIRILNLELEKRVKFRTSDLEKLNLEMETLVLPLVSRSKTLGIMGVWGSVLSINQYHILLEAG